MAHRGRLGAVERQALALAAGRTVREAAEAGLSERTAHRRAAGDAFRRRVGELRAGMVAAAAGRLADGMAAAAGVLLGLLADPDPETRLRAAGKVIDLGLKTREAAELEAEIDQLRVLVAGQAGGTKGGGP